MRIRSVKVGGFDIPVQSGKFRKKLGRYNNDPTPLIEHAPGLEDRQYYSVVVHECVEAMDDMLGIGLKERQILALENGILQWVEQNDELIDAIRALKKGSK